MTQSKKSLFYKIKVFFLFMTAFCRVDDNQEKYWGYTGSLGFKLHPAGSKI